MRHGVTLLGAIVTIRRHASDGMKNFFAFDGVSLKTFSPAIPSKCSWYWLPKSWTGVSVSTPLTFHVALRTRCFLASEGTQNLPLKKKLRLLFRVDHGEPINALATPALPVL